MKYEAKKKLKLYLIYFETLKIEWGPINPKDNKKLIPELTKNKGVSFVMVHYS